MSAKKICVTGSINLDYILRTTHIPLPGETISAKEFHTAFGGKGANQAVAAARLGAEVSFVGAVGNDDTGKMQLANFEKEGIITKGIETVDDASGAAYITVDDKGENCITLYGGSNSRVTPDWVHSQKSLIAEADALLLQLEIPAEASLEAARIANEFGVPVIFNPAPVNKFSDELYSLCSLISPNETELELLTGESDPEKGSRILLDRGVKSILVTMGKSGCYYTDANETLISPSIDLMPVKDTTAAGDSFNAAVAFFMSDKRSIKETLFLANIVGGLTVSRSGAQPSLPYFDEVAKYSDGVL